MRFKYQAALCKRIREKHEMSQVDLGKALGFSKSSRAQCISNLERGVAGFPLNRINKLKKFCTAKEIRDAYMKDVEAVFVRYL